MSRYTKKRPRWYWSPEEEAELIRRWPAPVIPGRSNHAIRQHALNMGLPPRKPGRPVSISDPDDVFSDRRAREQEARMDEKNKERARLAEEAERRARAPLTVGNGRVFRG